VSGKREIASEELPPGAKFFHKPYREASIVEAMTGMLSGVMTSLTHEMSRDGV
jgi:hypothetical protein